MGHTHHILEKPSMSRILWRWFCNFRSKVWEILNFEWFLPLEIFAKNPIFNFFWKVRKFSWFYTRKTYLPKTFTIIFVKKNFPPKTKSLSRRWCTTLPFQIHSILDYVVKGTSHSMYIPEYVFLILFWLLYHFHKPNDATWWTPFFSFTMFYASCHWWKI